MRDTVTRRILAATVSAGLLLAACGAPPDAGDGQADADGEPAPATTALASLDVERPAPDSPDVPDLVAGLNDVGYRLFAAAAADSSDDLVLSPLSIGIAFGMADAGATGATAEALADLFAYSVDGEARWLAFNSLEQAVTDVGDPVVRLANRQFPDMFLPRFDSDRNLDLRVLIEGELRAADIFGVEGYADIAPGITLENAVHAADIAIDEHGTVAAAATALGFEESGPPEPEVTVRADRPFLYLVRHEPTGAVLFVGRVLDPSA